MKQYDDLSTDNVPMELNSKSSNVEFIFLGLDEIAYVKKIVEDGKNIFGIFAADGEQIGISSEFELARAIAIQNDLYPVNVQ